MAAKDVLNKSLEAAVNVLNRREGPTDPSYLVTGGKVQALSVRFGVGGGIDVEILSVDSALVRAAAFDRLVEQGKV